MGHLGRPTVKDATRKLQLIAIHGAAITVDMVFGQVGEKYPSLDTFLGHTRFNAWRYAIGLLTLEQESSEFRKYTDNALSADDAISRYDGVLKGLDRLLGNVENEATSGTPNYEIRMRANITHVNNLLGKDSVSISGSLGMEPAAVGQLVPFGDHLLADAAIAMHHKAPRSASSSSFLADYPPTEVLSNPVDLRQRIAATVGRRISCPDLDGRFELASALAVSLIGLHAVGWMHKSPASSNIVFLPETTGKRRRRRAAQHESRLTRERVARES
ncbi:hypothetical protein DL771_011961 [Monosporascus sp. 5C6A]|nr:hypothetical protein DL771_011961 [Monosporascus sp. 5C6A]